MKLILSKNGGRFAESGSVMWMFERKGVVAARSETLKEESGKLEALELELIDIGAEDFSVSDDHIHVVSDMTKWAVVRDFLKNKGLTVDSAGLQYVAKQTAPVDAATLEKNDHLVGLLEEDDDVSEVHINASADQA